jgi:hypothetical protein
MIGQLSQIKRFFVSPYRLCRRYERRKSSRVDAVDRPTKRGGAINPGILYVAHRLPNAYKGPNKGERAALASGA